MSASSTDYITQLVSSLNGNSTGLVSEISHSTKTYTSLRELISRYILCSSPFPPNFLLLCSTKSVTQWKTSISFSAALLIKPRIKIFFFFFLTGIWSNLIASHKSYWCWRYWTSIVKSQIITSPLKTKVNAMSRVQWAISASKWRMMLRRLEDKAHQHGAKGT